MWNLLLVACSPCILARSQITNIYHQGILHLSSWFSLTGPWPLYSTLCTSTFSFYLWYNFKLRIIRCKSSIVFIFMEVLAQEAYNIGKIKCAENLLKKKEGLQTFLPLHCRTGYALCTYTAIFYPMFLSLVDILLTQTCWTKRLWYNDVQFCLSCCINRWITQYSRDYVALCFPLLIYLLD